MDHEARPAIEPRGFRWEFIALIMGVLLLLLGFQLWRRIQSVDPRARCANAYRNVHTAVDTGLVDRMPVRWPDRATRTSCGELRQRGELLTQPPTPGTGGLLPPRPRP